EEATPARLEADRFQFLRGPDLVQPFRQCLAHRAGEDRLRRLLGIEDLAEPLEACVADLLHQVSGPMPSPPEASRQPASNCCRRSSFQGKGLEVMGWFSR